MGFSKVWIKLVVVFCFMLLFFSGELVVQVNVSGVVIDDNFGEELIGVIVIIKGIMIGVVMDYDGSFLLVIDMLFLFVIVVFYMGYEL